MRKYWQVYKISVQNTLMYRGSVLIYRLANFLVLVVIASVWLSAKSSGIIGGYTVNELMTYYLVGMLMTSLVIWYPVGSIRDEINQGLISVQILPKPISYFKYKYFQEMGWHSISPLFGIINLSLALLLFGKYFVWNQTLMSLFLSFTAMFISAAVMFSLSFCIGLLSFWLTETSGLSTIIWMGIAIFGGQIVPVSFFSGWIKQLIVFLPFRYIFSYPLEIFTHRLDVQQLGTGFVLQLFWLGIFWLIGKYMWQRGLRMYSSYGN